MGRRPENSRNYDDTDDDTSLSKRRSRPNSSGNPATTTTTFSESFGLTGIASTADKLSRNCRPHLNGKESSFSATEEPNNLPPRTLSVHSHNTGYSTGDDISLGASRNGVDGTSTLDLVLGKRYASTECCRPDLLTPARLEAITGIIVDDATVKNWMNHGYQKSLANHMIYGSTSCEAESSRSNRTITDSITTVPDPPSLRPGQHYAMPGAYRMLSGGIPCTSNDDVESCMTSTASNINAGVPIPNESPTLVEASLVYDECFVDDECPPPPSSTYCGVSVGDRTFRTMSTHRSLNTGTAESPIVEALPMDGSQTVREFLRTRKAQCCILHITFLFVVLALGTAFGVNVYTNRVPVLDYNSTIDSDVPSSAPTSKGDLDLAYFVEVAIPSHTRSALRQENSPQNKALKWLRNNTFLESYDLSRRLQRFTLATLYFSTGGSSRWMNHSGWLSDEDECTWFFSASQFEQVNGDVCNFTSITRLSLVENNMRGTLPPEISLLRSLEVLEMSSNILTGFLPTTLGELDHLRVVDLFDNFLSGTVPSELGDANSLEFLDVEYNFMAQILPETLGKLSNLRRLVLDRNMLRGSIPIDFGHLSQLETLYAFSNELSGMIPSELGNLSNLMNLRLEANHLSGTISSEFGNWGNLVDLSIGNNTLRGPIPSEIGSLTKLTYLDMFHNILTGTLPSEIGLLTNIERVYLEDNQLQGTIPTELGNLNSLKRLWLYANSMTGTVPSDIGQMTKMTNLDLSYNYLTGELPTELGLLTDLESLSLEDNGFTGRIPSELGLLSNLSSLSLHRNNFSGIIPNEICLLVWFGSLSVDVDCNRVACICCGCGLD